MSATVSQRPVASLFLVIPSQLAIGNLHLLQNRRRRILERPV